MKKEILISLVLLGSVLTMNAQDIFMKYQRGYKYGALGGFVINGAFDINIPDNSSLWSDYPTGIGYATLNNFCGDKMFTQLLSNADNKNFWIRTSSYTDGTPSAIGGSWNKIWHSGNLNKNNIDFNCQNLFANGNLWAKEIKVALTNPWPDFVFKSGYKLTGLAELEFFIKENGHLPEIPDAIDVEKNGVNVGEMQSKLLQKIEELTLYVIEQNKKNEKQEQELKIMKAEIMKIKSTRN
jgi:hypothetical protein